MPADDWEFAEWRRARVNLDYHIEVHDFLYSVPHALIRVEVEVRITARTVEIFHRGQRVGVHQRRYMGAKHGTNPAAPVPSRRFPPIGNAANLSRMAYCRARLSQFVARQLQCPRPQFFG